MGAGAAGVGIGLGINWVWEQTTGQSFGNSIYDAVNGSYDPNQLQPAVEHAANYAEYKHACDDPVPPGRDACETAKRQLDAALLCRKLRDKNTAKWWGGEDLKHDPQMEEYIAKRVANALDKYDRLCKKKCP